MTSCGLETAPVLVTMTRISSEKGSVAGRVIWMSSLVITYIYWLISSSDRIMI